MMALGLEFQPWFLVPGLKIDSSLGPYLLLS